MDVIGSQVISSMYLKYKICIFYSYSDTFGKKTYFVFIFYILLHNVSVFQILFDEKDFIFFNIGKGKTNGFLMHER